MKGVTGVAGGAFDGPGEAEEVGGVEEGGDGGEVPAVGDGVGGVGGGHYGGTNKLRTAMALIFCQAEMGNCKKKF